MNHSLFAWLRWTAVCAMLVVLAWTRPALAQLEVMPDEITIGFTPAENAEGLKTTVNALADALSARIHVPVKGVVALDYTALVEAMANEQVQFGWLLPASLVLAEEKFHAELMLTQVRKGNPTYYSAVVVRENSSIRSLADLKGTTVAWVDMQSTSGYVIPRYLLKQNGFDPDTLFRAQVIAGGHDAAVIAVQNGQVDVAAVWADPPSEGTGAWTRYLKNRPGPQLRPILYSPPVPSDAVATHPRFSREHPRLVRAVREALIAIGNDPEGREILKKLNNTDGFVQADPQAYSLVREAYKVSRSSKKHGRFENPFTVIVFVVLCVLAGALALPVWKRAPRARSLTGWLLFFAAFGWSLWSAKLSLARLLHGREGMIAFLRGMFPVDQSVLPSVIEQTIITLQLALLGTVFAVPFALVAGFLAAENVMPSRWVRTTVRFLLNFNRSVDTLILALVLVSAVGLGPLPGVLALAVHSVGSLGKLFYEAVETLDPGPVEAMRSVGATPLQVVRWGIWPQFAPHFISIVLFRFELNVRVSTVLGLVGAGGIGFLLYTYMRGAEYAKVSLVIAAIVVLVMALDTLSTWLRKRVS